MVVFSIDEHSNGPFWKSITLAWTFERLVEDGYLDRFLPPQQLCRQRKRRSGQRDRSWLWSQSDVTVHTEGSGSIVRHVEHLLKRF